MYTVIDYLISSKKEIENHELVAEFERAVTVWFNFEEFQSTLFEYLGVSLETYTAILYAETTEETATLIRAAMEEKRK